MPRALPTSSKKTYVASHRDAAIALILLTGLCFGILTTGFFIVRGQTIDAVIQPFELAEASRSAKETEAGEILAAAISERTAAEKNFSAQKQLVDSLKAQTEASEEQINALKKELYG